MASKIFPNGVRQLEISKPTKLGHKEPTLRGHIILVAKFDFVAESGEELSVSKGDVLKLLDRLPSGWVYVSSIEKVDTAGLVPSLYVDIAVNDSNHPITTLWLHETKRDAAKAAQNTFNDVQVQMLLKTNFPLTINNSPYPLTATVVCYLACQDRFWYRVDVTYSTGEIGYLCRFYLDFFDLHAILLEYVAEYDAAQLSNASNLASSLSSPDLNTEQAPFRLPRLPEPIMNQNQNPELQSELFSKRCKELSTYLTVLASDKRIQVCPAFVKFLETDFNGQPGFVSEEVLNDSIEAISQQILPGSKLVATQMNTEPAKASDLNKFADISCYSALPKGVQRTKSLNYQSGGALSSPLGRSKSVRNAEQKPPLPDINLSRSRTISATEALRAAQGMDSTFTPPPLPQMPLPSSSPRTPPRNVFGPQRVPSRSKPHSQPQANSYSHPSAPSQNPPSGSPLINNTSKPISNFSPKLAAPNDAPTPIQQSNVLIRCEIKTPSNDVIAVKFKQAEITSVYAFKALLSRKIRFSNVYIRFEDKESYEELESLDFELFSRLKKSSVAFVLLT
ncbi:hypothetical protein PUMCH_002441 [Australozyma saopauloensis]|uniref:SH3 domain-containing protein n=1 Tax=Australozyma saopauloensis TaxID=291208 RepID=A0AAX4H9F1_9ASCO|nr:hypothetical protein PUMCH_002441 [[Candida] saopauloensis]